MFIPLNRRKSKINIKNIIKKNIEYITLNIPEIFLIVTISILFYLNMPLSTKRVIHIPQGSTSYIVSYLNKKNYNLNYLDKMIIDFLGYPQSGWIDLKASSMKKFDFLYKLTTSKAALRKFTIIPGETYYYYLQDLARVLNISVAKVFNEYAKKAYKKDGNILADTYILPIGMDEKMVINYLLDLTQKRYEKLSYKIFRLYNKQNWYRYITIASIIQKEAANKKEMPLVSSVIYNRLKKGMKLQMDGTLNYGKYSHTKITPSMIRNDTSNYNTYKYSGIPNDPVCAVELEAIKAAIFPANTNYLYFTKAPKGNKHLFSTSYKTHKRNIRKVQKYKKSIKVIKKKHKTTQKKKRGYDYKRVQKPYDLKSLWK